MQITELPPFTPRLEDYRAEEFLAQTLLLLPYPIEQDQRALDFAPFQVKAPPPPPEPRLPLLPHIWYPKPSQAISQIAPKLVAPARPRAFMGKSREVAADRVMRPLLAGVGGICVLGESGIGKTSLLRYVATHEKTRQRYRRIWFFDDAERVGQLGAILLGLSNVLGEPDPLQQLALLSAELDDDTLLIIDNLSQNDPLLIALQKLSPHVLLSITTPPEALEADESGVLIIPDDPPDVVTLRKLPPEDGLMQLAVGGGLLDREGNIPRELRPILNEMAFLADYHPLALAILAAIIRHDEIPAAQVLEYLREASADLGAGLHLALEVCLKALPTEYKRVLEAFGGFSPLGVGRGALSIVLSSKHDLGLQRTLTSLKRHYLLEQDPRYPEHYVPMGAVYARMEAANPHEPGAKLGDRIRKWLISFLDETVYESARLFEHEYHLRWVFQLLDAHKASDIAAPLRRMSDYFRTYIPNRLPHDAPPPRLSGERAQAVHLARQGFDQAENGGLEAALFDEGLAALRRAIEEIKQHGSDHDLAEMLVMQASLYDLRRDHAKALPILEEAARLLFELGAEESLSRVRLGLAICYRNLGRLKDALAVLDERPESEAERARIYRVLGDLDNMMRALGASPDMTPYAIAESYMRAGHYAEALAAIADDNSASSHNLRAMIYHVQGDYEHALIGYQRALNKYERDDPERANPARAMAAIYALREDFEAAEEILSSTLQNLDDPAEAGLTQGLLAAVHLLQGNNRTAVETANQALQKLTPTGLHEEIADVYRTLGRAAWRLERYEEALKAFLEEIEGAQSAEKRDETRIGIAYFHAAEAYRLTGQLDRAAANHRRALNHLKAGDNQQMYFIMQSALHRVLMEAERYPDALSLNQEIIEHLDRHPPPDLQYLGLRLCYHVRGHQALGQHERAYRFFARWLNVLAGRADALTDHERPLLALLALALATRSLLGLGRAGDALPLAEAALEIAEEHIKVKKWLSVAWSVRRDYGEVLLACGQWSEAAASQQALLQEAVKEQDPHTFAAAYQTVGQALHQLGEYRKALDHYWTALDVQPIPHKQGLLFEHVAAAYLALGDVPRAVENFNEAMKLLDRQAFPGDAARVLTTLAHTLAGVNRFADAINVYEEALTMLKNVSDASPLYTARVYASLGRSNETQGQWAQAAKAYRDALDVIEQHHVNAPDDYRDWLLKLARVEVQRRAYPTAIPYFIQARDEAHSWGTQQEVGNITRELAEAQRDGGHLAESLQTYEDGLELLPLEDFPSDRAATLRSYGQALAQTEQFEEARKAWAEALAITQGLPPLEIALTHHAIGQAHRAQASYSEAEAAFREALQHHSGATLEMAATYRELGQTLLANERPAEAIEPLQQALEIEKGLPQQSNARLVQTLELLGQTATLNQNLRGAVGHYHAALVYMDRAYQAERYAETLRTLGKLYAELPMWDNCQKALTEALDIETALKPRDEARLALTLRMIGDAYHAEGQLEKAANAYKKMALYANLSSEEAQKLRSTLDDLERYRATLRTAQESLQVLERTGAEIKDYIYVYALMVWMYFLLSEYDNSRATMEHLQRVLSEYEAQFSLEDERADYRAIAQYSAALSHEKIRDVARARDHYRAALKDATDNALRWLIEQGLAALG